MFLEEVRDGVGSFSLLSSEGQLWYFRYFGGFLECILCFAVVSGVFDGGLAFAQITRISSSGRVLF